MRAGRARAAARVDGPSSDPHPGARHRITPGFRIMHDQREVLALIATLVAAEPWRADRRQAWTAVLHRLAHSIDWQTGFISRVTLDQLGAAGGRGRRTVARVRAWAESVGLLAVVEDGATAEFLGSRTNRTPTYAFTTNTPIPATDTPGDDPAQETADNGPADTPDDTSAAITNPQVTDAPGQLGSPSLTGVEIKPSARRLEPPAPAAHQNWPLWQVPDTPAERSAAALRLINRIGLDHPGVCRIAGGAPGRAVRTPRSSSSTVPSGAGRRVVWPSRRLAGLLKPWWDASASVAGLLYAIDHHPDHPTHHRGDALRGARDPLAVLGARLRPWRDRLHELPAAVAGLRGDYLTAQSTRLAASSLEPDVKIDPAAVAPSGTCTWTPHSRPETRAAARAAVAAAQAATRARRAHSPAQSDPRRP